MSPRAVTTTPPCPRADLHYPNQLAPYDQLGWYSWAEHMSKTHRQQRCPGCGLFVIWVPKAVTQRRRGS